MDVKFTWLCGKCKKKAIKEMRKDLIRMRSNKMSLRTISKLTGVPHTTLHDIFNSNMEMKMTMLKNGVIKR